MKPNNSLVVIPNVYLFVVSLYIAIYVSQLKPNFNIQVKPTLKPKKKKVLKIIEIEEEEDLSNGLAKLSVQKRSAQKQQTSPQMSVEKRKVSEAKRLYLNEKFLRVLRVANPSGDSKLGVDRPTKKPIDDVLAALNQIDENSLSFSEACQFVDDNLHDPGFEIVNANFVDWTPMPKYIESFKSEQLRNFAYSLNDIWLDLHKKCDHSILVDGAVSSHLPMKHPFLVPGGRFIETYYWDNFWILEGILVSGMITTAQHILENHMHLIDEYGFVPNGSRVYYLNRSQPPYFANMVMAFYDHTQKSTELTSEEKYVYKRFVLDEALKCMIKEHKYWMRERSIKITHKGTEFKLNLFSPQNDQPRPESYSEDIHTASHCQTDAERAKCYKDLSAGAESGIDFSSRWFKDPMNIQTIHTTDIIPVCLNALLYKTETSLAMLCNEKADMIGFKRYRNLGLKRKTVINSLLWSKKLNCWTDYNHRTKKLYEKDFYITNLSPLFNDIKPPKHRVKELMEKHVCSLNLINSNGIPFSFTNSMEQWDFSNIWAPNQYQVIMLLTKVNRDLALKFAKKFFTTVYTGWLNTGMIFEKYSTLELGNRGSGGEYLVQSGFGWTNGTILSLMKEFGDELFS